MTDPVSTVRPVLHPQQSESLARQAVARNPDDESAWLHLLDCVTRNQNPREMVNLATQALQRFPNHSRLRLSLAAGLALTGHVGEAIRRLDQSLRQPTGTAAEALLQAEFLARRQPATALGIVRQMLDRAPGHGLLNLSARGLQGRLERPPTEPCIGLYIESDWHVWVFESIGQALADAGSGYVVAQQPAGFAASRPEVVILCSPMPQRMAELRAVLPRTQFINVRHGVSVNGKNYGLYSAAACDRVCASSPALARKLAEQALIDPARVWTTGYPQMDGLWRALGGQTGHEVRRAGGTVMFAPTFNEMLSAAYLIGDDPVRALRGPDESIRVILTAHPQLRHQAPALLDAWRASAGRHGNVQWFDSSRANSVTQLAEADVLVSDVSGMATQFVATGRPIVRLIDPQRAPRSGAYVSDGVEEQVAGIARTVTHVRELAAVVRDSLRTPPAAEWRKRQQELAAELFGPLTDGRAGERVATQALALMQSTQELEMNRQAGKRAGQGAGQS